VVIPNAIDIPKDRLVRNWRPDGRLRLAFLSRVHSNKGLDLLIPALAYLPDHVTLDISGDGDGDVAYVNSLYKTIADMGLTGRVTFHGHVDGAAKSAAFTGCDVFVLPTHSENFGIVVAEALAYGTPVITTRGVPWEGIETEGCGRPSPGSRKPISPRWAPAGGPG
jgi:glycosyltransferase involved in cell wall biosynthesis